MLTGGSTNMNEMPQKNWKQKKTEVLLLQRKEVYGSEEETEVEPKQVKKTSQNQQFANFKKVNTK